MTKPRLSTTASNRKTIHKILMIFIQVKLVLYQYNNSYSPFTDRKSVILPAIRHRVAPNFGGIIFFSQFGKSDALPKLFRETFTHDITEDAATALTR